MDIIDAHIHFRSFPHFDELARRAGHENSAVYLEGAYRRLGIVGAVVMGNRELAPEAHEYPPFLRYCVGLDHSSFEDGALRASLEAVETHLRRESCVGLKLYPGYSSYCVYDEIYTPFLELAGSYQKPVAIHTGETAGEWGLLEYSHPLTVDRVASRHRTVTFVLCHWGNPWVMEAAAVINKNPNVCADLSGLLAGKPEMDAYFAEQAGYVAHLKTWLHYMQKWDRLLYGTDFPLANMESYIEFTARLIPPQFHDMVFAANARRIYGLTGI